MKPSKNSFLGALDYLSVWEVAHRWSGYDPDQTNPKSLPSKVEDILRRIMIA